MRNARHAIEMLLCSGALTCACDSRNVASIPATVPEGGVAMDARLAPNCEPPSGEAPALTLTPVATGLESPLLVIAAPGDASRLFVLEQTGRIRVLKDGVLAAEPFLDLSANVLARGERGLLGLAFHPGYAQNRRLYVHYSASAAAGAGDAGTAVISEFTAISGNPDRADTSSERRLLTLGDPESNHNGGMLAFGPDDGFLYAGIGDGGGGGDEHGPIGNGQNLGTLFGKLLRLDVDGRESGQYGIPPGNMTEAGALPEIWSYGWRNPWRFSFDPCTSDLYVGDVGQGTLEEIDFEPASAAAGNNYGWRRMEGDACYEPEQDCNPERSLVLPVATYPRDVGRSVTGGYVYRGHALPGLRGTYFYADYATGRFFSLRMNGGSPSEQRDITDDVNPGAAIGSISSFGTNNAGEVFVTSLATGAIYRIDAE